jgi:hypothetical protein
MAVHDIPIMLTIGFRMDVLLQKRRFPNRLGLAFPEILKLFVSNDRVLFYFIDNIKKLKISKIK